MNIEVDAELLKKTIISQEQGCSKKLGSSYNYHKLMEAVIKELNLALGSEEAASLADAFAGPRYRSWLFPGTEEALRKLHNSGQRMGIIANTAWPGFCMDRAFAGVNLLPFLDIRIYSGDIGIEKPDPAIFKLAERFAELKGKCVLYVGNDIEKDTKGAKTFGWSTALRIGPESAKPGIADLEFFHISELVIYCQD